MADRKISDLTALTTPASGDFLPIVDISEAAAASKNKRITIEELMRGMPDGTAAAPGIAFETDPDTGIYSSGANQLSVATNGTERLRIDATGQIEAVSLGTAAAPTFTFTGDPNTGIYSPGADQVAVATNGAGRLFVDASGRVGIESAPWNGAVGLYLGSAGHIYGVGTNSVYYNTNAYFSSGWKYNGNSAAAQIEASAGRFIFNTAPLNSSGAGAALTWSERLRITDTGLVGIGTSAPGYKLDVNGEVAFSPNTAGKNTYLFTTNASNDASLFLKSDTTNKVNIQANGSSYFNGGNVGIGTSSPGAALHVRATSSTTNIFENTGNTDSYLYLKNSTSGAYIGSRGNDISFSPSNGVFEAARIDSSGRLLIGTSTSALEKLVIKADGGGIQINRNDSGNPTSGQSLGSIGFKGIVSANSNAAAEVLIQASADENHSALAAGSRLEFYTKPNGTGPGSTPTERMRIKADGTVLMNNTSGSVGDIGFQFTAAGVSFDSVAASTSATNTLHVYSTTASAYRFYVGMDGTVNATNTTISAISDQRFKENIRDLDVGLNQILALQPRRFDWKPGKGKDIQNDQGFIAQEFEQVFPEMIGEWLDPAPEGEEPYKSVRADLIPVLVKAIQEQQAIINGLEARLTALETN